MASVLLTSAAPIGMAMPLPRAAPLRRSEIDPTVVRRCQVGDRAAFRMLVLHYERPIFAFLYRTLGHDSDVEDLAQEVFLRAHRAIARFDPEGPARLSTWLFTIANRLVQDERRKRFVRRLQSVDPEQTEASSGTPESEEHNREIGRAVAAAAQKLPPEQRDAFVLAEYHELGMAEMAVVLGVGENTVKTRLFRARERLRAMLEPLWQETKS